MKPCAADYPMPTNVPARVMNRLLERLVTLARKLDENQRYSRLDDNFGSLMLEYTLSDLKDRPYPFQSESDYWQEAQRRFRVITCRNVKWKSYDRARDREQLLDEQGWEIETNLHHCPGSVEERRQRKDDPTRRLLEEDLPTPCQLIAALHKAGIKGRQAEAWLEFRWEEAESYRELSRKLLEQTGEQIQEGTLRKWEQRLFRNPEKMACVYTELTGEAPTPDMIARLMEQKRYSLSRRSNRSAPLIAVASARQDTSPAGACIIISLLIASLFARQLRLDWRARGMRYRHRNVS